MNQRIILTVAIVVLLAGSVFSAVPSMINYQGRLIDSTGSGIDTTVNITFIIYDSSLAGNAKWSETHSGVIVNNGLFDIILGSVVPIQDSVFNKPNRFLGVTVSGSPEMAPRTQLVSVGFAIQASKAVSSTTSQSSGFAD